MRKLFQRAIEWLRSIVTATIWEKDRVKREEANSTRSVKGEDFGTRPAEVAYGQTSFGLPESPLCHTSTLLLAERYIKEHYQVRYNRRLWAVRKVG